MEGYTQSHPESSYQNKSANYSALEVDVRALVLKELRRGGKEKVIRYVFGQVPEVSRRSRIRVIFTFPIDETNCDKSEDRFGIILGQNIRIMSIKR